MAADALRVWDRERAEALVTETAEVIPLPAAKVRLVAAGRPPGVKQAEGLVDMGLLPSLLGQLDVALIADGQFERLGKLPLPVGLDPLLSRLS